MPRQTNLRTAKRPRSSGQQSTASSNRSLSSSSSSSSSSSVPRLGYCVYGSPVASSKIAAFDLDMTLISSPSSNIPHATRWVPLFRLEDMRKRLLQAISDGYVLAIMSNQGGIRENEKEYLTFQSKLDSILEKFDVPCHAFFACSRTKFRKPLPGMWEHLVTEVLRLEPNLSESYFVGDAAGRRGDHSDTDYKFACNLGIRFVTPESYFAEPPANAPPPRISHYDDSLWTDLRQGPKALNDAAFSDLIRPKSQGNESREIVLIAGRPASGKSTLAEHIASTFGHALFKNAAEATVDAVKSALETQSVVIDDNFCSNKMRLPYIKLAEQLGNNIAVRFLVLDVSSLVAQHLDGLRCLLHEDAVGYTPGAFTKFEKSLELPSPLSKILSSHVLVPFHPRYEAVDARLKCYKDMYLF